ncbi:hypothetical protein C8J56DRAFT_387308 [Mycena floridula]|nr:hypothetical protein C8J56DRAFT_387308 [Mycena floridula]
MSRFPTEIQLLIAAQSSISSLANLSLCSHHLRTVVFPLLNQSIHIRSSEQLLELCTRITEEQTEPGIHNLQVAGYIKHLQLDEECEQDAFDDLVSVIPHLQQLEGFAVTAQSECACQNVIDSIRRHCPRFNSLSVFLLRGFEASDEDLEATFGFAGLRHLRIDSFQVCLSEIWMDNILPPSIINTLCSSPALETLILAFDMDNGAQWNVHEFFKQLDGMKFPKLRVLQIRQSAELDLWKVCEPNDHFMDFLVNHHEHLEVLHLPSPIEDLAYGPEELEFPANFFPKLSDLEGPSFLCMKLSELPLPSQGLKKLTILLDRSIWDGDHDHEQKQVFKILRDFVALESFSIRRGHRTMTSPDMTITPSQIRLLAEYNPKLKTYSCPVQLDDLDELGLALAAFPQLQVFATNLTTLLEDQPLSPQEFLASLARHCDNLRTVEDIEKPVFEGKHWQGEINRLEGITVKVSARLASEIERHDRWD